MAISLSTNYDLAINVMKLNRQRAGLTWGISGFANLVGLLGK
jgi:hypothetical protein